MNPSDWYDRLSGQLRKMLTDVEQLALADEALTLGWRDDFAYLDELDAVLRAKRGCRR